MYKSFRPACERLLRIPHDPAPPPGDESSTRIFRAAPNYYRYLLLLWALKALGTLFVLLVSVLIPLLLGTFSLVKHGHKWGLLLSVVLLLVLAVDVVVQLFLLAVIRLEYDKRWYVVTDRSLRIREGVLTVREMTVNFANIQNISTSQGPIQRVLGIADLRVDTAGGGGGSTDAQHTTENLHTAWFRGIDNASEVRELILQRLHQLKDSGLGDHEEQPARAVTDRSSSLIQALREVHAETQNLRQAAARLSTGL
ncbi:MAG TPA: PH domain-containing protein [Candidatus Sulfotelmatobacter sp.]|nr:PH domain-containing protein [Candidatus Sulfotelmatobacter sp.]